MNSRARASLLRLRGLIRKEAWQIVRGPQFDPHSLYPAPGAAVYLWFRGLAGRQSCQGGFGGGEALTPDHALQLRL